MSEDTYPKKLEGLAKDNRNKPLVCSGCAHSASSAPFPGRPSGERPCFFCIRNVERVQWQQDFKDRHGVEFVVWYDQSPPIKVPMDCYHSVDMKMQIDDWMKGR